MQSQLVKNWFGDQFKSLHPLLQKLHLQGGILTGDIKLSYGQGIAGIIGRRLAKKMGLPESGNHQLTVTISHDAAGLHWGRCFNNQEVVESLFIPQGNVEKGYWIEKTGPLEMKLTVDIHDEGWHWRCLKVNFYGIPLPLWLIPKTIAYKYIENDKYCFHVEFVLPFIGSLVSYEGLLAAEESS